MNGFRFIHSSDWHLDRPVGGLAEVPEHLRDLFIEAPYLAAESIIRSALSEQVDLVILAGDLIDIRMAGPIGAAFLASQFERLAQQRIPVYWASGTADRAERWTEAIRLPANVHRFTHSSPEEITCQREGTPLARIIGVGRNRQGEIRASELAEQGGLFSVGVAHASVDPAALRAGAIDYWALGGRHQRSTLYHDRRVATYSGTPQGRRLNEHGPHGCTLVDVDPDGRVRTKFLVTDVVRLESEELRLSTEQDFADLPRLCEDRLTALAEQAPSLDRVIAFKVVVPPNLGVGALQQRAGAALQELRARHENQNPICYVAEIELISTDEISLSLLEQENVLGDFLRDARQIQLDPQHVVDLSPFVSERRRAGPLKSMLTLSGTGAHARLGEVAQLAFNHFGNSRTGGGS